MNFQCWLNAFEQISTVVQSTRQTVDDLRRFVYLLLRCWKSVIKLVKCTVYVRAYLDMSFACQTYFYVTCRQTEQVIIVPILIYCRYLLRFRIRFGFHAVQYCTTSFSADTWAPQTTRVQDRLWKQGLQSIGFEIRQCIGSCIKIKFYPNPFDSTSVPYVTSP